LAFPSLQSFLKLLVQWQSRNTGRMIDGSDDRVGFHINHRYIGSMRNK
jgi:hypothetical protein